MSSQSKYRHIFKATSLFGGVQIISIIVMIIRAKFVALLIGAEGMGIFTLLMSTILLLGTITGMGLNYSGVRDISQANETGDPADLSLKIAVFRRLVFFSCLMGLVIIIAAAPLLSEFTFGNDHYIEIFMWLSLTLVFTTLTNGNHTLLQGTRQLRFMAQSTIFGAISGLFISIPFYYFMGIDGIAPSLVFSSFFTFLISLYFARKIVLVGVEVKSAQLLEFGKGMAALGFVMVTSQFLSNIIVYFTNTFIRSAGNTAEVGLYQAGTMITTQSIGLVFTAMAIDYYPRLISVAKDNLKVKEMVNEQGVISVLISLPLLSALIVFSPLLIHILLTPEFYVIENFIRWLALGMMFTAPIFVIGYIALAKGDKKNYFLYNSFFNSIISFACNIIGYKVNGLTGMAVGYCIFQVFYTCFIYHQFHKLYLFTFTSKFVNIFSILAICCLGSLISTFLLPTMWGYVFGIGFTYVAAHYSFIELNKLMGFLELIKQRLGKAQ